ncbi:hypothetical protein OIU76_010000 [Salix suchowensis]|nr:hypothetical protein OIU76_010000 [Salix suchowensis]
MSVTLKLEAELEFFLRKGAINLKVEGQFGVLKLKKNQLEECVKEAELEREKNMEPYKELESKKEIEKCYMEIGLKDKKIVDALVKFKPTDNHMVQNALDISDANLCSYVTMNGKASQMFLNEYYKDRGTSEVKVALQVLSELLMLVLNAIEGFCPPHLKKGDLEFEASVAMSCILLLKKLMKISPEIRPRQKRSNKNCL